MNVFDFDGTIYDGDSSLDFWLYCLRRKKQIVKYFPKQLFFAFLYKMKIVSKEDFKSVFFSFIEDIENINGLVSDFWDKNIVKIKSWYLDVKQEDDCIISASPDFLLKEACKYLGVKHLISTRINPCTGKLVGENCYGNSKVYFFKNEFPDVTINNFYSDSKTDIGLAKISKCAFLVKKNKIIKWESL